MSVIHFLMSFPLLFLFFFFFNDTATTEIYTLSLHDALPLCTSTIAGFPSSTLPGLLDALNHLNAEYRWVTRYLCLGAAEAKALIEKYRKQWWAKRKGLWTMIKEEAAKQEAALVDSAAASKAADADAALQELGEDLVSYGYLTTTITVWDRELEEARRKSQRVKE